MTNRAVFLDRDGTLIEDAAYMVRPEQIRILRGVARALARLADAGYKLVVVTNQSGIARGLLTEDDLNLLHQRLDEQLELLGARVDVYYTCPHHPDPDQAKRPELAIDCDCRKPKPGLILQAAQDLEIDLANSWMLGDMWRDIQAGQAAGVRTIKLPADAAHESPRPAGTPPPTAEVADMEEAADVILESGDIPEEPPDEPAAPEAPPAAPDPAAADKPKSPDPMRSEKVEMATEKPRSAAAQQPSATATSVVAPATAAPVTAPCARCGVPVTAAQVFAGEADRRGGALLCPSCLALAPGGDDRLPANATEALKELLAEVRRLGRTRHTGALTLMRLTAYVLEAGALFCALAMSILGNDRTFYIQAAIFLQLLVLALLLFERNS
jgi:D-glycero-D-manno-heptose 1,7-bisphosphate phosphatase